MTEVLLEPRLESIAMARRHVREALAGCTDPDTLSRVELVVSELVTNALRHGPKDRPVTFKFGCDDGVIAGEVEDQGHGTIAIRDSDPGTMVGGLGLPIVDRLTSDWGVYPGSTHVWFRFG